MVRVHTWVLYLNVGRFYQVNVSPEAVIKYSLFECWWWSIVVISVAKKLNENPLLVSSKLHFPVRTFSPLESISA